MARRKSKVVPAQRGWVIYLRTSDEESQNPETSQARQRFIKDVLTGRTPLRTDYQRMLEDARMGKFSYVVVERADRFGRNDTEALRVIDELHEFGAKAVFAYQPDLDPIDADDWHHCCPVVHYGATRERTSLRIKHPTLLPDVRVVS